MSVTRGQCDARPTVTFPGEMHHRPLAGTKLCCLVTEARVLKTCPGLHSTAGMLGFERAIYCSQVQHLIAMPPRHHPHTLQTNHDVESRGNVSP